MQDASSSTFYTLEEYRLATETLQKNKEGKLVVLYTTQPIEQDSYIKAAQEKGYIVVKMETLVDSAFINNMEMKWDDVTFKRVDSEIADNLIDAAESSESVLNKEEEELLKNLFEIKKPALNVKVEVKGLSAGTPPVVATRSELMRRMKDMASMGGDGMKWYGEMPDEVTLTVNGNHPVYKNILLESEKLKQEKMVNNLADLALLSQGLLKGSDLTNFISRSVELMEGKEEPKIIQS